jgi:Rps23 Pro-64 3,4-dihydroxylase Tpa1-like proline 4-hydroxylase
MMTPDPFPHIILDGEWRGVDVQEALREMVWLRATHPTAWQTYSNGHEQKHAMTFSRALHLGAEHCAAIGRGLASPMWIARLERLTGLEGLTFDDLGGGLHYIPLGGFLDVHVDFNRHDDGRYRRVNVLVYLNHTDPSGALELWATKDSGPSVSIYTAPNRTVVFLTSDTSWHGHPSPLAGTGPRCSLAAYYYTSTPPERVSEPHSTIFLED